MGDQAALQEAIQRAKQLAAKISAPVKRPPPSSGESVRVTLAYEKPIEKPIEKQLIEPSNYDRQNNEHSTALLQPQPSKEKIELIIPHAVIGLVIGKGGENIKRIQNETGALVRVDPNTIDEQGNKQCTITGTKQAVEEAHAQISHVIENASTSKRPKMLSGDDRNLSGESYRMKIPATRTGAIIGRGGETIKTIKQQSGCEIELDKNAKDCERDESVFIIRGPQEGISKARSMIEARLASRGRDHQSDSHSNHRSRSKEFATGANAAPVAKYTDLPSSNPDMSAAWAAYYAQYTNLLNQQATTQPAAAAATATNLINPATASMPTAAVPQISQNPAEVQSGQPQQDYTDQWIEYYIANGRPDYAEQIIQMKKQQQ